MTRTTIAALILIAASLPAAAQGPAYPYHVPLTWTLSADPPAKISGYNVYRAVQTGATCGTFTKINPTLLSNSTTSFDDTTVADVTIYCYAGTSVDTNNKESGFSNVDQDNAVPAAPPTGFGATVAQNGTNYDVLASWTQSKDPIVGDQVRCGKKHGGPYTFAEVTCKTPCTKWTFRSVPAGTFFCIADAVAMLGKNNPVPSGPSNEARIVVP